MKTQALLILTSLTSVSMAQTQTSFDYNRMIAPAVAGPGILTESYPVAPVTAISFLSLGITGNDEIDALSFGDDQIIGAPHSIIFSIDPMSVGLPGSGSQRETVVDTAPGIAPAAAGDLFVQEATIYGNLLAPPGLGYRAGTGTGDEANATWGAPCGPNGCFDLDAFEYTSPGFATGVYFSLAPASPTLGIIGATPGDILYSDLSGGLPVIATLAGIGPANEVNLGIVGLNLDALNLLGTTGPVAAGGGVIIPGMVGPSAVGGPVPPSSHFLEFSVSLSGFMDADILVPVGPGAFAVHTPAAGVGLANFENLNALEAAERLDPACPPLPATVSSFNGSGINLDVLSTSSVVIGAPWTATISPQTTRGGSGWFLLMRSATITGPVLDLGPFFGMPAAGLSQLLVSGAAIGTFGGPPHGGGGTTASLSIAVPFNCALLGQPWAAQAIVLGDLPAGAGPLDPWFSTATEGSIGMY